jgi:hypothetical protein
MKIHKNIEFEFPDYLIVCAAIDSYPHDNKSLISDHLHCKK